MAKTAKSKSVEGVPTVDESLPNDALASGPTQEEIAVRAYHISLERGVEGDPVNDWLQAERELTAAGDIEAE
ncbi:MAG: DUF2934 domain-containing protein [Blastocatellia bacterium]